jgi:hypothetical protein
MAAQISFKAFCAFLGKVAMYLSIEVKSFFSLFMSNTFANHEVGISSKAG